MSDTYTCAQCGGTFAKRITDEEALAEAERLFGHIHEQSRAVVCEDCFKKLMAEPHAPHKHDKQAINDTLAAIMQAVRVMLKERLNDESFACAVVLGSPCGCIDFVSNIGTRTGIASLLADAAEAVVDKTAERIEVPIGRGLQ